jgi:RimJ/RimL family protein N-acetyltransferase
MVERSRVALRARTDGDEDVLFRLRADLDTWEERNPEPPAPLSLAAYRESRSGDATSADVRFVITLDGAPVGSAGLFHEDTLARYAEVGIALLAEARGQGVGTEALRQLVEFAFVRRNLRRLHLVVIASNTAAIASYAKLGFVEEGRRREHCWVRGRYEDEVLMGLLRSEWRSG